MILGGFTRETLQCRKRQCRRRRCRKRQRRKRRSALRGGASDCSRTDDTVSTPSVCRRTSTCAACANLGVPKEFVRPNPRGALDSSAAPITPRQDSAPPQVFDPGANTARPDVSVPRRRAVFSVEAVGRREQQLRVKCRRLAVAAVEQRVAAPRLCDIDASAASDCFRTPQATGDPILGRELTKTLLAEGGRLPLAGFAIMRNDHYHPPNRLAIYRLCVEFAG